MSPEKPRTALTRQDQAQEFLLMGLRLKEGINLSRYAAINSQPLPASAIEELTDLGMLKQSEDRIIVSNQGFMVLNAVISRLLDV